MKRILYTVGKDLKVLFRNYLLLFSLVIGPVLLMLLIGFTFGGETIYDIRIGVYSSDSFESSSVLKNLEGENIQIITYTDEETCKKAIMLGDIHLCAVLTQERKITFYYDHSSFTLAKTIVEYLKDRVGFTAEQMTLESTETLLDKIEESITFMNSMLDQLDLLKTRIISIRGQLQRLHQDLAAVQEQFEPHYLAMKRIEPKINATSFSYAGNVSALRDELQTLHTTLLTISEESTLLDDAINSSINSSFGFMMGNLTLSQYHHNIQDLNTKINESLMRIDVVLLLLNTTNKEMVNFTIEAHQLIQEMDQLHDLLNRSLVLIEQNIQFLDEGIHQIDEEYAALEVKLDEIQQIQGISAEDIVKPFAAEYKTVLAEKSRIKLIFPTLFTIIIMFVSILLSTLVVLNEINSSAHFRSILLPVSPVVSLLSLFFTNLIIVALQVIVFFLIAHIRFHISVFPFFWPLLAASLCLVTPFIFVGMIIAYLFKKRQTSLLISIFATLGIFLYSNVLFPLEGMSRIAAAGAAWNPLVVGEAVMKKLLLFHLPISSSLSQLYYLVTCSVFLFLVAVLVSLRERRR